MKHIDPSALVAMEIKGEGDEPEQIVTKALGDLQSAVNARLDEITAKQLDAAKITERLDKIEAKANRPGSPDDTDPAASVEVKSFGTYLRRGDSGLSDIERKALTVGTDASAGFLAPTTFGDEVLKSLTEHSPIRQFATVKQIGGKDVRYPRRLTGTAATWVAETANRTESSQTYEQVLIAAHELATFVEVSKQLMEDNAYDLAGELATDLGESFAVAEGSAFVTGDGNGKPTGILEADGVTEMVSGAAATLGTAPGDTLISLFSALPTSYAQNGAWAMNRVALAAIRKIKDTTGNYLWQPSLREGSPSTLLGRPIIEAIDMPDIEADAFPIVFGDWSGYRIVDRVEMSILADPYTRATNGITVFHARKRVGGDVTHPGKFVKLKIAAA